MARGQGAQSVGGTEFRGAAKATHAHPVPRLTKKEFRRTANRAFERLSAEERSKVADYLRSQGLQNGTEPPNPSAAEAATDHAAMASTSAALHPHRPHFLRQLRASGGVLSSPVAKAALLGITAMAAQRLIGRR